VVFAYTLSGRHNLMGEILEQTDLSVIVVNWNTCNMLRACLSSLLSSNDGTLAELWVVDNASSDGSVDMVRRDFPTVRLIANQTNVGFAAANNQALKKVSGDYILLLNSDTVAIGDALKQMVNYLHEHPFVGAVGCKLLNADGSVQRSCWRGFPGLEFALVDALYLWKLAACWKWLQFFEIPVADLREPMEVDHLLGACIMVRRTVVDLVGGLDQGYFLFLEETDWCYRIKKAGYQIHYLPTAQIIHHGEQSIRKKPERFVPELYRSYCHFCRKQHRFGLGRMAALKLIIAMAAIIRIGLWGVRFCLGRRRLASRMLAGYLRVLVELPGF